MNFERMILQYKDLESLFSAMQNPIALEVLQFVHQFIV